MVTCSPSSKEARWPKTDRATHSVCELPCIGRIPAFYPITLVCGRDADKCGPSLRGGKARVGDTSNIASRRNKSGFVLFHFEFGRGGHAQWSGVEIDAVDSEPS